MSKLIEFTHSWLQKGKQPLAKDGVEPGLYHAQEVIDPIEMQPESRRSSMTGPVSTLRTKEGKTEERNNQGRKHHTLLE